MLGVEAGATPAPPQALPLPTPAPSTRPAIPNSWNSFACSVAMAMAFFSGVLILANFLFVEFIWLFRLRDLKRMMILFEILFSVLCFVPIIAFVVESKWRDCGKCGACNTRD